MAGLGLSAPAGLESVGSRALAATLSADGRSAADAQLKQAGVKSMGHRLKIINALQDGGASGAAESVAAAAGATAAGASAAAPPGGEPDLFGLAAVAARGGRAALGAEIRARYSTAGTFRTWSALLADSLQDSGRFRAGILS